VEGPLIQKSITSEAPVIAVRWWGAGNGCGEGAVPPSQKKNFFYIKVERGGEAVAMCKS